MDNKLDFEQVNKTALFNLSTILARWLPDGQVQGAEYIARNPRRADRKPGSFKINMNSGKWSDFATGDAGGDVISLTAYLAGLGQADAARNLAEMLGVKND
jgi:hypothetical protein